MSASLRELQRLAGHKPLHILRFPPTYYVVTDHTYDVLKRLQQLDLPNVEGNCLFQSEHFLEVRGFIKGYKE